MHRNVRVLGALAGAITLGAMVFAGPAGADPDGKTTICHGTSSDGNPEVVITISDNALKAHLGDTGTGHSSDPGPPGPKHPDFFGTNCVGG